LVIVTPHHEQIREEFAEAFVQHWQRTTGESITIDWRVPGGTSEIASVIKPRSVQKAISYQFIPLTQTALREAGVQAEQLDAVAATQGPGLPAALMVGFKAGQAMAFSLRKPFVGIHHHEAHLYSPWITGSPPRAHFDLFEPNFSLIVSGGHTMLVLVESQLKHRVLGGTIDDAAGECFDKTGKLMGLAYPAGPIIDRLTESQRLGRAVQPG